jgi:hypothetical protein
MIFEFPGVDEFSAISGGPSTEVYLRSTRIGMAMVANSVIIGFPYATANNNVKIGIFGYGQSKGFMPTAISFDSLLSTGHDTVQLDTSTNPDTPITGITLVKNFGNNLLVAWKDMVSSAITYGVDYLNDTSTVATSGKWAGMWFDGGRADKEKTAEAIKIVFASALPAGCTVTPRIRYNRDAEASYINGDTTAVAGDTEVLLLPVLAVTSLKSPRSLSCTTITWRKTRTRR